MHEHNIAIVVSQFNAPVTKKLLAGACRRLQEKGVQQANIKVYRVPGVVEIPLIAKQAAKQQKFDAIITLGAVIRGETTHYDYVCQQVSDGVAKVMYDYELPVVFGILTTENSEQAFDRVGGAHGHKGREAADCAMEMMRLLQEFF